MSDIEEVIETTEVGSTGTSDISDEEETVNNESSEKTSCSWVTKSVPVRASKVLLPMIIDNIIFFGSSFIDSIIVSELGSDVLASSSYISNIKQFCLTTPSSMFFALQPLVTELPEDNENTPKDTAKLIASSVVMSGTFDIVAIPTMLVSHKFVGSDYSDDVKKFFRLYVIGVPANYLIQIINQLLLTTNRAYLMMPLSIIRTITEIGLSYFFIHTLKMGVSGWGLGTGLQPWISLIIASSALLKSDIRKHILKYGFTKDLNTSDIWRDVKRISVIGAPIMLQAAIVLGNTILTPFLIGGLGPASLASYQIAYYVSAWGIMILDPLSQMISVLYKQMNSNERKQLLTCSMLFNLAVSTIIIVPSFYFQQSIVNLFVDSSDENYQQISQFCETLIPTMALTIPLYATKAIGTGMLRSDRRTSAPTTAEFLGMLLLSSVLTSYFVKTDHSVEYAGFSQIAGMLVSTVVLLIHTCLLYSVNVDEDLNTTNLPYARQLGRNIYNFFYEETNNSTEENILSPDLNTAYLPG